MDDLSGRVFGRASFIRLKSKNYGNGRMATFSELIDELYADLKDRNNRRGRTLTNFMTFGTGSFFFSDTALIYRQDFVNVIDNIETFGHFGILANENKARKVEQRYKTGEHTLRELAENPLLIALVDGQERANKAAEIASCFSLNPIFLPLIREDAKSTEVRFPSIFLGTKKYKDSDRLYIHAYDDVHGSGYVLKI